MMQPFVLKKGKDGCFSSWVASHVLDVALLYFMMAYACTIDNTNPRGPFPFAAL